MVPGEEGTALLSLNRPGKFNVELKATDLLGQPTVFEPEFFNRARIKSVRTRGFFPCPDFVGTLPLVRLIGIAFPRTSPEYRAYVQVAYKKPGRWAAMLYDGVSLLAKADALFMRLSPEEEARMAAALGWDRVP